MSGHSVDELLAAMSPSTDLSSWNGAQWDRVIRLARNADVVARIGESALVGGSWDCIPPEVRRHIESAQVLTRRQHDEIRMEVAALEQALQSIQLPLVLLKGAAYALAGLRASAGRMVSDLDILVPRERLADVEMALMLNGWISSNRDAYDQRYYRKWMHELPPMIHMKRGTSLDVHHAILPLTARLKPNTALLLGDAVAVDGYEHVRVLSRVDMVLHSATHLFHEGELELGFRGLVDLDALLREFSPVAGFWDDLFQRARELDLEWPLFYALRYTLKLLGTPVPEAASEHLKSCDRLNASGCRLRMMDALFLRALLPAHELTSDAWTPLARFALYVRGHWLRMPPWLLVWHLLHKAISPSTESTKA